MDAVFFDYDGVLTRHKTGTATTCRYLSDRTGIPYATLREAFDVDARALRVGNGTRVQHWPALCERLGRDIPFDLLFEAYDSTPVDARMFDLARGLRGGCVVGIITDNTLDRFDRLKEVQRLPELFSPIVVSAEVGSTKSDARIFEHALRVANVAPGRAVFIDNTRETLDVASSLGMHAIHFDDDTRDIGRLAGELASLGVRLAVRTDPR
jgi:putative hydrolase of the HAD superfamily